MRILVTGAEGQLGTELMKLLSLGVGPLGAIPAALREAEAIGVGRTQLDISDYDAVRAFIKKEKPDVLVNCAAYTNVDGCEGDPDTAFRVNALGAQFLARGCAEFGTRLMQISTDYVFSGEGNKSRREWDTTDPRSVYGHSKRLGEDYVRQFCPQSFIVRTAWLYGYYGNNFVKTILKAGREKGQLMVVEDQRGSPTNASDLAFQLLKILQSQAYGIYHCTNHGECSWYEFACAFLRLADIYCIVKPCSTDEFPRLAPRPARSSLDNQMLHCTVGDTMRSWQDAVADFMSHYNKDSGEFTI